MTILSAISCPASVWSYLLVGSYGHECDSYCAYYEEVTLLFF